MTAANWDGPSGSMTSKHGIARAIALTAFVFGLLVSVYVVIIWWTHPEWFYLPFSHVNIFPFNWQLDDVGMSAVAVAAVGFLAWRLQTKSNSGGNAQ